MPRPRDSSASAPLRALLGAFATYHRAGTDDPLPEGVIASLDPAPFDARVFASHAVLTARVSRWDADELGREIVAHAWDLRPEARDRLNPALLGAALDAARSRTGIRVSNRGGAFHSRPDALATLAPTLPAATFLTQLIEGAVAQAAAALPRRGDPSRAARSPQRVTTSWHNVSRGNGEDAHGLHDHAGARWSGAYYVAVPPDIAPAPARDDDRNDRDEAKDSNAPLGAFRAFRSVSKRFDDDEGEGRRDALAGHLVLRVCSGGGSSPEGGGDRDPAGGWCVYAPIAPEPGRLVVFPSHTLHGVLPFEAKEAGSNPASEEAGSLRVSVAFNAGEENVVLPGGSAADDARAGKKPTRASGGTRKNEPPKSKRKRGGSRPGALPEEDARRPSERRRETDG